MNSASLVLYASPFLSQFLKNHVNHVVNANSNTYFDSQDLNELRDKTLLILPLSQLFLTILTSHLSPSSLSIFEN